MSPESSSYRIVAISLIALIALGPLRFVFLENMSYFDGLYMTVITLSTVGFGEIEPLGEATQDETLGLAGITRAETLVSTLPGVSHKVYLTLTALHLNPRINIIARADHAGGRDLAILIEAGDRNVN